MNIRPTIFLLALALAFQPLSAQVSSLQSTKPAPAQSSEGQDEDEDRKGSNVLAPALVGGGLVAGAVVAGTLGGDGSSPAAVAREEGNVYVPGATSPEADPTLGSGDPSTTTTVSVPEPGILALMGLGVFGLMGVAVLRRRDSTA